MKVDNKFIKKLDKFVEKYGKREKELDDENITLYDDADEEMYDIIKNYYFYYEVADVEKDTILSFGLEKEESSKTVYFLIFDEEINKDLIELTKNPSLYSNSPELEIKDLYYSINSFRNLYKEKYGGENRKVKKIINMTEDLFKDNYSSIDNMIKKNTIDYDSLWYYLDQEGEYFISKLVNEDVVYKHESFEYIQSEKKLFISGTVLTIKNENIMDAFYEFEIKKFQGTKKLDSLNIKKYNELDQTEKNKLINNGKQVSGLRNQIKYMKLKGRQYSLAKDSVVTYMRDCRVILDNDGLDKFDNKPFRIGEGEVYNIVKDDEYSLVFPFVGIYSMGTSKSWGMAHVLELSDIEYRSDAFDYLVLDQTKKNLLKGLIRCHRKDFSDFIEGKGQGLIFLLNGPPGVGKTLTAEATAEYLNKPLYNINVGDLGTNPEIMEDILERIIEYCERWGAIILIDEADIFLEEREYSNVLRNSMVSTFLKFLEFNRGIMFLTTNRLNSIDDAVKSRVNMFFSYQEFSFNRRVEVWKSILSKWNLKVEESTIHELSELKLNGREIRNYLRLVVSIIDDRKITFSDESLVDILKECYDITNEFNKNVSNHMYQ